MGIVQIIANKREADLGLQSLVYSAADDRFLSFIVGAPYVSTGMGTKIRRSSRRRR